jgi:hypothetical protein
MLRDSRLRKIGEDVTETLELIPRQWKVIQHVRERFSEPSLSPRSSCTAEMLWTAFFRLRLMWKPTIATARADEAAKRAVDHKAPAVQRRRSSRNVTLISTGDVPEHGGWVFAPDISTLIQRIEQLEPSLEPFLPGKMRLQHFSRPHPHFGESPGIARQT